MTPQKPNRFRPCIQWAQLAVYAVVLALVAQQGYADAVEAKPRFQIKDTAVYLDMDGEYVGLSRRGNEEIPDHYALADIIFENPDIDTVFLTGKGGSAYNAERMTRSIMRARLEAVAHKECLSACAVIFLGGVQRRLAKGGILGFHRAGTDLSALAEYYDTAKHEKGWTNEFQFAEWNFQQGQIHAKDMLRLALENGISPHVVLEMLEADNEDMWFPEEAELVTLGVISLK